MAIAEYEERIAINPLEVGASGGSPSSGLEIGGLAVPYGQVADIHERGNVGRTQSVSGLNLATPRMAFASAADCLPTIWFGRLRMLCRRAPCAGYQ